MVHFTAHLLKPLERVRSCRHVTRLRSPVPGLISSRDYWLARKRGVGLPFGGSLPPNGWSAAPFSPPRHWPQRCQRMMARYRRIWLSLTPWGQLLLLPTWTPPSKRCKAQLAPAMIREQRTNSSVVIGGKEKDGR